MQGVIKSYDPASGDGIVVATPISPSSTSPSDALDGSIFRMLRQGQRVVFDLDADGRATQLRLGSEVDMETPGHHVSRSDASHPVRVGVRLQRTMRQAQRRASIPKERPA